MSKPLRTRRLRVSSSCGVDSPIPAVRTIFTRDHPGTADDLDRQLRARERRGECGESQQAKGEPATTEKDHRVMAGGDGRGRARRETSSHGKNVRTQTHAIITMTMAFQMTRA